MKNLAIAISMFSLLTLQGCGQQSNANSSIKQAATPTVTEFRTKNYEVEWAHTSSAFNCSLGWKKTASDLKSLTKDKDAIRKIEKSFCMNNKVFKVTYTCPETEIEANPENPEVFIEFKYFRSSDATNGAYCLEFYNSEDGEPTGRAIRPLITYGHLELDYPGIVK